MTKKDYEPNGESIFCVLTTDRRARLVNCYDLWVHIYHISFFGHLLVSYIGSVINPIGKGLADQRVNYVCYVRSRQLVRLLLHYG